MTVLDLLDLATVVGTVGCGIVIGFAWERIVFGWP